MKAALRTERGLYQLATNMLRFCAELTCRFLVSNDQLAPFEQTENLYRRYGSEFSKDDRRRIQDFLFSCECEEQLQQALKRPRAEFRYKPHGNYCKGHAEGAAARLRRHFGHAASAEK